MSNSPSFREEIDRLEEKGMRVVYMQRIGKNREEAILHDGKK